jgi:RNA polymerase sigma factor (sigma-70 family)
MPVGSLDGAGLLGHLDARFRRPLMSFFLRRIGDRAEAEDLTQEVFVRLIGAIERDQIRDADALVFKIAGNLLRDRMRRAAIHGKAQIGEFDDHLVSELTREFVEEHSPERVVLARAEISAVLKALSELGERTKDIYVLFRLEGMKQRQIATLYRLGISTVEREVARATLHLALRFGPEDI